MPFLPPKTLARLRLLEGEVSAVEAAKAFRCSPETVRRLWRGETHFKAAPKPTTEPEVEESMSEMMKALKDLEEQPGPGPGGTK